MNPGPELDALIAKQVMGDEGYTVVVLCPDGDPHCETTHTATRYKPYSTDMTYALPVLEWIKENIVECEIEIETSWEFKNEFNLAVKWYSYSSEDDGLYGPYHFTGESMAHVICLAALRCAELK